jgi:hypothetical protein
MRAMRPMQTTRSGFVRHLLSAIAFVLPLSVFGNASAEPVIGVDGHGALAFKSGVHPGAGGTIYAGYSLDLEPVLVEPELAVGLEGYPGDSTLAFRGMGGVRVGFTGPVEPSLFVHLGYGFLKPFTGISTSLVNAFAIDSGVSVDYRPKRWLTIGGTVGYEGLIGSASLHGIFLGPRIAFWIR